MVKFARPGDARRLKTSFQALVVRSVRMDIQRADKLVRKLAADGVRSVDVVLLPGDLADGSFARGDDVSEPLKGVPSEDHAVSVALGEGDASTILGLFEHISLRVFYVPGTRDPPSMLRRKRSTGEHEHAIMPPKLTNLSVNLHNWWVQIDEGLVLAGFGGESASGVSELLSNVEAWNSAKCMNNTNSAEESSGGAPTQILLMTHVCPKWDGEHNSQALDAKADSDSGREVMRQTLLDPTIQDSVLVCVAGGEGIAQSELGLHGTQKSVCNIPVVNPDSFVSGGHYALISFERATPSDRWTVSNVSFESLDV